MSNDRYKIEVIHIFHPHLIWIKINSGYGKDEFVIEQIGLYGLLPLEISVNPENTTIETLKCNGWMPAATSFIKKIVSESNEIWFTPTLIDRRVSIFDDNIHKYGEIEVKINNKLKRLSKHLIKSSLAHEDICLFHQKLSNGEIKTRLNNVQIEEVIKHFMEYFKSKRIPKKVCDSVLKKQMSVYFCSQQFESVLTKSNLEKHNNLMIKRVLSHKMKDLELCKDVEEESIGRASYKVNESTVNQLPSELLNRELDSPNRNKVQDTAETYNNIKKFLDKNSMHHKKFEFVEKKDEIESRQSILEENNTSSLRLRKLNNIKKSNQATIITKEKIVENDIVFNGDLNMKKIVNENNNSPKVMKNHVICGPPGIIYNPRHFKINIEPQVYDNNQLQNHIIDKQRDDDYNMKLGDVESEINIDVKDKTKQEDNKFDNQNTSTEVFDTSTQNDTTAPSSLLLKKILRLNKKKDKNNESADTSFEDTSKEDDSIDEDIDKVMDRLNSKYSPISVNTPKQEMDQQIMVTNNTKLKNHVNAFKNIDPNISVFVDNLVTPILMVHSKSNKRLEPVYEMRNINFNSHTQIALRNMAVKSPMTLQTISWFTVLRGYSLFMISPKGSGKTMGYLPAVCCLINDYSQVLDNSFGPIAIIVCATAKSVTDVEKTAKMFLDDQEHVISCYAGVDDLDITARLLNKCNLLICTPPALVRLLKAKEFGIDLGRLCTFILDDCERLTVVYSDEIKLFLLKIKEIMKKRVLREIKVQFILASRVWCDFMGPLAKNAPDTVICIGAFQECVLYSKANTSVSYVKPEKKNSYVSEFLKHVDGSKRTIIVCRSDDEVRMLTRDLKSDSYIFSCDSTMTVHDLYNLNISWMEYEDPLLGPLLICCDDNLTHMNITNAHNLIHYSLPSLFSTFCKRFSVLNDHYPSIFNTDNENIHIKIFLEAKDIEMFPKIINFIKRCTDSIPDVLNAKSEKVLVQKDARKAEQLVPICNNLLGLGCCPDMYNCKERHTIFKEHDVPKEWLPKKGIVAFKILHYHSAVLYSARLLSNTEKGVITKYSQTYNSLSMKMGLYYSKETNRKLHGVPEVGDICTVSKNQNFFVRCQVIEILTRCQQGNPNHVLINLIDEEKFEIARDIYLYYIPDELKHIETRTVQVRLANIKPLDDDITFSELAKHHVEKITKGDDVYLRGNISLIIGNSIFIDNPEVCEDLTSLKKTIVKHNIIGELLGKHAMVNFDHMSKLRKLCVGCDIEEKQEVEPTMKDDEKIMPKSDREYLKNDVIPAMKDDKKNISKGNCEHLENDSIPTLKDDEQIMPKTDWENLRNDVIPPMKDDKKIIPKGNYEHLENEVIQSMKDDKKILPKAVSEHLKDDIIPAMKDDKKIISKGNCEHLENDSIPTLKDDEQIMPKSDWENLRNDVIPPMKDDKKIIPKGNCEHLENEVIQSMKDDKKILPKAVSEHLKDDIIPAMKDDEKIIPKGNCERLQNSVIQAMKDEEQIMPKAVSEHLKDDNIIPAMKDDENIMPKADCEHFKNDIILPIEDKKKIVPEANWAYLEIYAISCVFFDSAISPDTFFIRLDKFESCMIDLIKDIQNYVNNNMKPLTTVVKGDLVIAKFPDDSTYERARVDDISDNGKIKCFFVDYGDWRDVPISHLFSIPEKIINQLPFQAIECRLISIQPPGENWSDYSTNWLCDNCLTDVDEKDGSLKRLYVKCFTKGQADFTGGYKYGVLLIDTNSDQDIIINKIMIEHNLAQANPEEIEYLNTFDLNTIQYDTAETLDEDEWEKVSMSSSKTELNTLSHVFMQKPLRSVPLIDSDEEYDDCDRWDINDDLIGAFQPAFNKMAEQAKPQLLAIENNAHKESTKCLPDEDLDKHCFEHVPPECEPQKIIELDSDDLTSSESGKSEQSLDQSPATHVRCPKVVWQQNKKNVTIKIQIIVDGDYELEIEDRKLTFKTHANETNYDFDMELYGVVDKHKCFHANKGQYILIKLTKLLNQMWLTLTRDGTIHKMRTITYDADNIDTSSDEEVLDVKPMENIIKSLHYRTESESGDSEIFDDANFIYGKREL